MANMALDHPAGLGAGNGGIDDGVRNRPWD